MTDTIRITLPSSSLWTTTHQILTITIPRPQPPPLPPTGASIIWKGLRTGAGTVWTGLCAVASPLRKVVILGLGVGTVCVSTYVFSAWVTGYFLEHVMGAATLALQAEQLRLQAERVRLEHSKLQTAQHSAAQTVNQCDGPVSERDAPR